jgi:hypothetical protein
MRKMPGNQRQYLEDTMIGGRLPSEGINKRYSNNDTMMGGQNYNGFGNGYGAYTNGGLKNNDTMLYNNNNKVKRYGFEEAQIDEECEENFNIKDEIEGVEKKPNENEGLSRSELMKKYFVNYKDIDEEDKYDLPICDKSVDSVKKSVKSNEKSNAKSKSQMLQEKRELMKQYFVNYEDIPEEDIDHE